MADSDDASPPGCEDPPSRGDSQKRRRQRGRVLLAGRLVIGDAVMSTNCVIKDLSPEGARVATTEADTLPNQLGLLVVKDGAFFECEVAWRKQGQLGLHVRVRHNLAQSDAKVGPGVRALWRAVSPR